MAKVDFLNRAPITERLPDGRLRATLLATVKDYSAKTEATLEAEVFVATATQLPSFGDCRLIRCRLVSPAQGSQDPQLELTYEELHATNETQVGKNTIVVGQDGRKSIQATFLQFSAAPATPGTIGTSVPPAPDEAAGVLSEEKVENDGTLRTITRTYIASGILQETTEYRNNGKLEIRTIQSVGVVPTTPAGFTLVETKEEGPNGLPVYTYQFAQGEGRISRKETPRLNGKLKLVTIRYLGTDDGDPESGTLIDTDTEEREGYVLITETYSAIVGDGIVRDDIERKNNGKLIIYRKSRLGTAPAAPAATISGTVVETDSQEQAEDGHILYSKQWAEGKGVIDTTETKRADGTVIERQIRELGAAPSTPSGFYVLRTETTEQEGVTLYSYTFRLNEATAETETVTRIGTDAAPVLQIKRYVRETATPPAPAGFALVDSSIDQRDDGRTFYRWTYAKGDGEASRTLQLILNGAVTYTTVRSLGGSRVQAPGEFEYDSEAEAGYTVWRSRGVTVNTAQLPDETETRNNGALEIRTRQRINAGSTAPTPGTWAKVSEVETPREGFSIFTTRYAKGDGQVDSTDQTRQGGKLLIRTITHLTAAGAADPLATPPTGYTRTESSSQQQEGYLLWRSTYAKGTGRISLDPQAIANGKAVLRTVRFLDTDDGAAPAGTLIATESSDVAQDGYTLSTRVYLEVIGDGVIEDTTETRNNGKLKVYRKSRINSVPATPSATIAGTVVETRKAERPERYYVLHSYEWAEGKGRISLEDEPVSRDQVTLHTVRYLNADDDSAPAGDVVSTSTQQQDGHALVTKVYLEIHSSDPIETTVDTRNNGKLKVYRRTKIGSAPTAPSATIGGTVVATSTRQRTERYYIVYENEWAEGRGRISLEENPVAKDKVVLRTIRYLDADSGTAPAGTVAETSTQEQDGVTLTTKVYLEIVGDGVIANDTDTREGGKLVIYRRSKVGSAPTAPSATIGGTVTAISATERPERYYTVHSATWAEGLGEVSRDLQTRNNGALKVWTIVHLTALATATDPTSAPEAEAVSTRSDSRNQDGYRIWTAVWAKGTGMVSSESSYGEAGLETMTQTHLIANGGTAPAWTQVINKSAREEDGYEIHTGTFINTGDTSAKVEETDEARPDGSLVKRFQWWIVGAPATAQPYTSPSGYYKVAAAERKERGEVITHTDTWIKPPPTRTCKKRTSIQLPGSFSLSSSDGLKLFAGAERTLAADMTVAFSTTSEVPTIWHVMQWPSFYISYKNTETGQWESDTATLRGISGSGSIAGATSYMGRAVSNFIGGVSGYVDSAGTATGPTGLTVLDADSEPYLTDLSGTVVYRNWKLEFTFP